MTGALHTSVLLEEAVGALRVRPGGKYIDGTLGRGGHACAIARLGGKVLGIDRDGQAIEETLALPEARAFAASGSLVAVKGDHGDIATIAKKYGWENADGILLDLGVSSPQLDEAVRGFSFMRDGPLDMRMDRSRPLTAAEIVNTWSVERIAGILRDFGEERRAGSIARAIAARRESKPFSTTLELSAVVARAAGRSGPRNPATRTFQALRMAVNDETGELERALDGAAETLAHGGRLAVIAFESLTDRMVKRFFAAHAGRMESLPQGGQEWRGLLPRMAQVTKKPVSAGEKEMSENPRARSAKLRAAEKI